MGRRFLLATLLLSLGACTVDEVPTGLKPTPPGNGPTVRFDASHKPLPEIPTPNDAAMWPDPTSRTGLRINASEVAPTNIEVVSRRKFGSLEGWGTYAPISVAFDRKQPGAANVTPLTAAVDLENVRRRHQRDDYELQDDVIYVVSLKTGIPVPLDLGEGSFQYVIRDKARYFRNDTRKSEANLLFDTADETANETTGELDPVRTTYKPEYDTDFDGVLDRPNLFNPTACMNQAKLELALSASLIDDDERARLTAERDGCLTDGLLGWYERETDTLIMRPLIPLEERTRYAVVITDRLVDAEGNAVRSPFDFVYHPSQEAGVARLAEHLTNPELASYYGDIGGSGLEHVAFTWTFTTQPIVEDLRLLRDGLYGVGPFADLGQRFPAQAEVARAIGKVSEDALANGTPEPEGWEALPECAGSADTFRILRTETLKPLFTLVASEALGFRGPTLDELSSSFDAISHVAVGRFRTPFLFEGGRENEDPNASFVIDFQTGETEVHEDYVQFIVTIPRATGEHKQPFPVVFYGHGYTGMTLEALGFAGQHARQGLATVAINAVYHGLDLDPLLRAAAEQIFANSCAAPFGSGLLEGRARDLNHDGSLDSGGDYWTAYLFHLRDVVRQSVVDALQLFRILKTFDGKTLAPHQFARGDEPTLAGDFDGDGVPDIGGPDTPYSVWGQSLGGILAPVVAALEPAVIAVAPGSGAAGLTDVGLRTTNGGAFEGIYLREFGPLVVGVPGAMLDPGETRCEQNEVSLRMIGVDVNRTAEVEFQCFDAVKASGGRAMSSAGTVIVANAANGTVRCARMESDGTFRIGIPSSQGDKLSVQVWDQPDAVATYHPDSGCPVTIGKEHRIAIIDTWGNGLVAQDTALPSGSVCSSPDGCSAFQDRLYPAGSPLVAVAEGLGFIRQTPSLRRFSGLAAHIVDAADPVNFAPHFALRQLFDPSGLPHPPTAMLNFITIGDNNVPVNAGVAIARAAGAVPFLAPDAGERYPAYADYVTPSDLYVALRDRTPNRVLIDNHVLEGVSRLMRHPPAPGGECLPNEVPIAPEFAACHPPCTCADGEPCAGCLDEQVCIAQVCVKPPVTALECKRSLVDVDVFDESTALLGEVEISTRLRLARLAQSATASSVDAVWEPRLAGEPMTDDETGWLADRPVLAHANIYVRRDGEHGIYVSNPCSAHNESLYGVNVVSRFFATRGTDVYYLSHPATHLCLAQRIGQGACPFIIAE